MNNRNYISSRLFAGSDYDSKLDHSRLYKQIDRIFHFMKDGKYRTLNEIKEGLERRYPNSHFPEASVSAQLRNLRKQSGGCHEVKKRRRGNKGNGLFEYRLIVPKDIFMTSRNLA